MSKYAFLGLAAILCAAGNAAKAYADGTEAPADSTTSPAGDEAPKRRGRPPGSGAAAPADNTAPAGGATAEDDTAKRLEKNRALIEPFVKGDPAKGIEAQGEKVKKIISQYSQSGLAGLPADKQAAFEKDLDALSY